MRLSNAFCLSAAVILLGAVVTAQADVPQLINYQGILLDSDGDPVTTTVDVIFAIWTAEVDGDSLWSEEQSVTPDEVGRFNVLLGVVSAIPDSAFAGDAYLSTKVESDPEMSPRPQLVSVAFAYRALKSDTALISLSAAPSSVNSAAITDGAISFVDIGQNGAAVGQVMKWGPSNDWVVADDNVGASWNWSDSSSHGPDSVLFADSANHADTCDYAQACGYADSTDAITDGGVDFADIGQNGAAVGQIMKWGLPGGWVAADDDVGASSGWTDDGTVVRLVTVTDSVGIGTATPSAKLDVVGDVVVFGKATIGPGHTNTGSFAFVAGENNTASGDSSTVSGGRNNTASAAAATVGGGADNVANADRATVGGGAYNNATGFAATVGGGTFNVATALGATVGGGVGNLSIDRGATVGGGSYNKAGGKYSVVAGGGGGSPSDINGALGDYSAVGGGVRNLVDGLGDSATVAGGANNTASNLGAAIGGGTRNTASGIRSTVAGGSGNTAGPGNSGTVGGGSGNTASDDYSVVSGGQSNSASGSYSNVCGGQSNAASKVGATVAGGVGNFASGYMAAVGGGNNNTASGRWSTVAGGVGNTAEDTITTVGGGRGNTADSLGATVSGGDNNSATKDWATVGGGLDNLAGGGRATVAGGQSNEATGARATVGGGYLNVASAFEATVGGGAANVASQLFSTVSGGLSDTAKGEASTVSGGQYNKASSTAATVSGGQDNLASGAYSTVSGGHDNLASGSYSTAPGGYLNEAVGDYSLAAGRQAIAATDNTFIWNDGSTGYFSSTDADQFLIGAAGGVGIGTSDPGTSTLKVTNGFTGSFGQMVYLQSDTDPATDNDMLAIDAPSTAPNGFQFIECARGTDNEFKVNGNGNVYADGSYSTPASDFAEMMRVSSGAYTVEPGDVMVIDPNSPRATRQSREPRSTLVAGIYSTKPGFIGSQRDWDKPIAQDERGTYTLNDLAEKFNEVPLALVGIVPCKVSTENGPIRPGDLLVTSATPGHAMRDGNPQAGTILGKALEPLSSATGVIKVLVTLQ
jgi:hypothetical protein